VTKQEYNEIKEHATMRGYKVVRMYRDRPGHRRTIIQRCTEAEARAHCNDPETSSSTCKGKVGKARTRHNGPWFDGYMVR
jgi:hypothetical protein